MIVAAAVAIIALSSAFLFVYGVNLLYLSWQAMRLAPAAPPAGPPPEGTVLVQLPIYNERYVAGRVIDAVARLDWPRDRLEVQVLDDSDDDTPEIVASKIERWRRAGLAITHVRRSSRAGYKAGALAHGLSLSSAPMVAIFDADFVPAPDFLRRTLPALADPEVGFVQARWGHLNEDYSLLTYLQALMVDFHFLVEQAVRPRLGMLTNFAGSAGVWRRAAIDGAGGWRATTLTEDLDLSYRAQLCGWRAVYLEDVVVPQELPVSASAYRAQQARWATGSFQCVALLLLPVLRSRLSAGAKFQAAIRLLAYAAPVAMLLQIACYPVILVARSSGLHVPGFALPVAISLLSLAPPAGMAVAEWRRGRDWWEHVPGLLGWTVLGAGISLTVVGALWRALRGGGEFARTPKYRIERLGEEWRSSAYFKPTSVVAGVELACGVAGSALFTAAIGAGQPLLAVYSGLFAAGFVYLSGTSLVQSLRQLRYEEVALRGRALLPVLRAPALVASLGVAMLVLAQALPDPFEDSYQHWLIAANLATTGRLQDPLFQMQDTWLPAYHLLAALVLRVTGTWQLGALRALDVGLAVGTLGVTYRLAGSGRRGLLAVALLALNPIFVLTSTQAVAEPLLVLLLLAAVAARRREAAALLAGLACLTGTKAWLWLGCLLLVMLATWSLGRSARESHRAFSGRLAWVVPALAVAVALQATFGFASHSVARAAVEVSSATARGSAPGAPLLRGGQFLGYFALASLPIVALAPLGLARGLRGRVLTMVALPSILYLAVVTALVLAGVYTGSHRYYYPALPGLALAAAAAAERLPRLTVLAPVAVAAAVVGAYVPVLNGLAADNRGLQAAGSNSSTQPGGLLTDSPAAAFWSHKPVAEIYGSRALPADRDQVLGWLSARNVHRLVLEDVDYYRARAVLPDLVAGRVAPPYVAVGDQAEYTVPGGKSVHVYGLGTMRSAPIVEGVTASLDYAHEPARGKTAPLAKGLVLEEGGRDVAGEGMGFGVPIARYADGWHYPGTAVVTDLSTPGTTLWRKTFDLDMVGGDNAHGYRFQPAPSVGRVEVTYRVMQGRLQVTMHSLGLAPGVQQVSVLNEESSAFDDFAEAGVTRLGADFGRWQPVTGKWARLRSGGLHVEWAQYPYAGAELDAGRELTPPDLDWSGLDYVFGPGFRSADYTVSIRRSPAQ